MPELVEFLTEAKLADDIVPGKHTKLLVADTRGELIARRIVQSTNPAGEPVGSLYQAVAVEYDATLPVGTWELA